jgi:hypothetical protein
MNKFKTVTAVILGSIVAVHADEQNGLSVNISRKTTDRAELDEGEGTKIRQTLRAEIKNLRLKALPPGEIHWTVLVKKKWEGTIKHIGKESLKALKPSEATELMFGDFGLSSVRSYDSVSKDKSHYEIVIRHGEQETYRFATASNFAELAKKAQLSEEDQKKQREAEEAAELAAQAARKKLQEAQAKIVVPPMPATPAGSGTGAATAPAGPTAPLEPKVNRPPVDFFNLGGK